MTDFVDTFFKILPILRDEKQDDLTFQILLNLWSVMSTDDRIKANRYAAAINKALPPDDNQEQSDTWRSGE